MWVKMEDLGDHRCQSSLVFTIQLLGQLILIHTHMQVIKQHCHHAVLVPCIKFFLGFGLTKASDSKSLIREVFASPPRSHSLVLRSCSASFLEKSKNPPMFRGRFRNQRTMHLFCRSKWLHGHTLCDGVLDPYEIPTFQRPNEEIRCTFYQGFVWGY